ncbi:MAG: DegT/DnrJ/EryC1/StrS family aminotransferase [Cyclobacteriaceae bacterium]
MIPVTKPFLPPINEYNKFVRGIWKRNWLTNNGPLVKELERQLCEYLELNGLLFLGNGTVALQIAIKALGLKGEIITTPFSYVATSSSIVWENCTPVFVDIDPLTLNINAKKIREAITSKTSCILATHVFGNPCDIDEIEIIAKENGLKTIYDGAHAFGSKYKGRSVFEYGDVSTSSFHATKLFHTIEGGAVIASKSSILKRMAIMRNFGHTGPDTFGEVGINGKNSEFHAAMGIVNLTYVDRILARRQELSTYYDETLVELKLGRPLINDKAEFNYAYYSVIFESERSLLSALKKLNQSEIFPRRYFFPVLSQLPYVKKVHLPVAERISSTILCLPLYYTLTKSNIRMISKVIKSVI